MKLCIFILHFYFNFNRNKTFTFILFSFHFLITKHFHARTFRQLDAREYEIHCCGHGGEIIDVYEADIPSLEQRVCLIEICTDILWKNRTARRTLITCQHVAWITNNTRLLLLHGYLVFLNGFLMYLY
jgi:hypothetical protein